MLTADLRNKAGVSAYGGGSSNAFLIPIDITSLNDGATNTEIFAAFDGEANFNEFIDKLDDESLVYFIQEELPPDAFGLTEVFNRRKIDAVTQYQIEFIRYGVLYHFNFVLIGVDSWQLTKSAYDLKGSGSATKYTQTFEDADLTTNNITITHNLNTEFPMVSIYNSEKKQVIPDEVIIVDANNIQLQMPSFTPLVGTYTVIVL